MCTTCNCLVKCTCEGAGTCEACKSVCTCEGQGTCEACTK